MRDLKHYPITTDEIVAALEQIRDKEAAALRGVGDLTLVILDEAIQRIHRLADLDDE